MASNLFSNLSGKITTTFFHLGSSVSNSNYQEARRRIKEAAKNNAHELSLSGLGPYWPPPPQKHLANQVRAALKSVRLIHLDESVLPFYS